MLAIDVHLTMEHNGRNNMTMKSARKIVPAGQFKARCLGLIEQVSKSKEIIIVTKHGRPVVKVVPIDQAEPASLRGSVRYFGDIVDPTGEDWDAEK